MRIAAWLVAALVVAGLASVAWRGILIESDTMRIRSPIVDDSRPWSRTDCVYLTWRGIVRLTGEPQLVSETAAPGAKPACRLFLR